MTPSASPACNSPSSRKGPGRRNCRDCRHYQRTESGPRCRFRGARPSGVCAVFQRLNPTLDRNSTR
ncbi:hypothetical protein [Motiliproteus sp.]|uniref:hypothetical protein n=1 Tax=Motiliproteus sp. TaxID=1898955 RepID=UPI003BA935A9